MTTTAVSTTSTNTARQVVQGQKLADNFNTFLKLLTSQLQNQDPLEPLKSNEFTQQLVQFSSVEQQLETNKLLNQLVTTNGADGVASAVGFIGKTITAEGDKQVLSGGQAEWKYDIARNAQTVQLNVINSLGRTVTSTTGELGSGVHSFTWDGKDALGRQLVDGGQYKLHVVAKDATGIDIEATPQIVGRVRAVETGADGPVLVLNASRVNLNDVKSIAEAPVN